MRSKKKKESVFNSCSFYTLFVFRFVQILEDYIDQGGKFSKDTSNIAVRTQLITKHINIDMFVETTEDKIAINITINSTNEDSDASITVPSSVLNANDTDNTTLIVVYYRTSKLFAPEYRKTEVCKDSFTTEKVARVERSDTSSYTMENSTGSRVTESSPVLSASLRKKHVANLSTPVIIKFKMPHEQVQRAVNIVSCVTHKIRRMRFVLQCVQFENSDISRYRSTTEL